MFLDYNVLKALEKDYGFPITELTTREQLWFVASLDKYHKKDEEAVQSFTKKFGLIGARAFLATEFGDEFRGTILGIAEKFPEEDARKIFESFSEIVTFAQETADNLGKHFFVHDETYDANAVRAELLSRAKKLLITFQDSDVKDITAKLESFQSDNVLFASMFKVTQKGQVVKFEDIKGLKLETLNGSELSENEDDCIKMETIARKNWNTDKPEITEVLMTGMKSAFQNTSTQWHLLRRNSDILAFIRFDNESGSSVHAASLHVNSGLRGSGIGEAMMHAAIISEAKKHIVTAEALLEAEVSTKYVEDIGFVIIGIETLVTPEGPEIDVLKIRIDKERNANYEGKSSKLEHPSAQLRIRRFDISKGTEEMIEAIRRETAAKNVGTRFFVDPTNPDVRYIAFEPEITLHAPVSSAQTFSKENQTSAVQATQ